MSLNNEYSLFQFLYIIWFESTNSCLKFGPDYLVQHPLPQESQTNDDNKTPYLKKIEECIYKIWDAEDFERFSEIFINTSVTDKQQQVENGKIITETGRTETKNLFFGAICFLNENDIEAVIKLYYNRFSDFE